MKKPVIVGNGKKKNNDKSKNNPGKKKAGIITVLSVLVIFLLTGITYIFGGFEAIDYFLFYRHCTIDATVISDGSFPVSFSGNDIVATEKISSKMFVLTKKLLTCISYKGRVLYTESFTFVEPDMKTGDKYGVVFDRGSAKYIIFDAYGIVYEGTTEDNRYIITADVDSKGNCVLATKSDDSACRVYMVDKNGETKYIWSCADEYAVCLDVSKDSKQIICGTIGAYSNEIYTKVYCLDVYSDSGVKDFKISGTGCVDVSSIDKNSVMVDCTDKRVLLNTDTADGSPVEVSFPGKAVLMSTDGNGNLAVVTERHNSFENGEITLYDSSNSVVFRCEAPEDVHKILCSKKKVYCLTDSKVITCNGQPEEDTVFECDVFGEGLIELRGKIYYHSTDRVKKAF